MQRLITLDVSYFIFKRAPLYCHVTIQGYFSHQKFPNVEFKFSEREITVQICNETAHYIPSTIRQASQADNTSKHGSPSTRTCVFG